MQKILIQHARLSFPSLSKKAIFEGQEGKYEATLLIDKKDEETYKKIKNHITQIVKQNKVRLSADKICLKDGDESDTEGYSDHWYIKSTSNRKPKLYNKNKEEIEQDDIFYPGCYVNAVIDCWFQNNKYGKRINCNLFGIMFCEDGEPFGQDSYATEEIEKILEINENSKTIEQYSNDIVFP